MWTSESWVSRPLWPLRTTSPFWERSWAVGLVTEFVLPNVSIDDWTFGVMAVDQQGHESLVSSYVYAPRERRVFDVGS